MANNMLMMSALNDRQTFTYAKSKFRNNIKHIKCTGLYRSE